MNVRLAALIGAFVVTVFACTTNPTIDGSTVAKIGSPGAPPSCKDLCARLEKLCGQAPSDCTLADGGGYCDQYYDDTRRECAGQAPTCLAATDCTNAPPPDASSVDAADEKEELDAATEAASDASSADAKSE